MELEGGTQRGAFGFNGYTYVSLYSWYSLCSHSVRVAQKHVVRVVHVVTKKIFHIEVALRNKIMWVTKKYLEATKKLCDTEKRDSYWLNLLSVLKKRKTCWKKIVPVVYKYMLCID